MVDIKLFHCGFIMLFHCGFILYFLSENDIFSYIYWPFGFLFNDLSVQVFAYFSTGLSFSYWLVGVLYLFWVLVLYWYYMLQISSFSLWFPFFSFDEKFLILTWLNLSTLSFMVNALYNLFHKSFPTQRSWQYLYFLFIKKC